MKYSFRKKESIINLVIVLIGAICLYGITVNMKRLEAAEDLIPEQELELQEVQDLDPELDIQKIYNEVKINNEGTEIEKVAKELVGNPFLKEVTIKDKGTFAGVTLNYVAAEHEVSLTKTKKDQIALINSSVLMSLYPEVDAVKSEIRRGNEYYEKVLYRLDLNDYFGVKLEEVNNLSTFERIAGEFFDTEKVTKYWSMKHPYDSYLGESVEKFFKFEFPAKWGATYPYIDEDLQEDLVDSYGYKLFIQGLNYDHPLMNYYCAYRLIEYYDNNNLDEIIIELAGCRNKTDEEQVRKACDFAIKILTTHSSDKEINVFTRYSETDLQGGMKLYSLRKGRLVELASWKGKDHGGFKVLAVSPDQQNVLCEIIMQEKTYLYNIPVNEAEVYKVNETGIIKEGIMVDKELLGELQDLLDSKQQEGLKQGTDKKLSMADIEYEWVFGNMLSLRVGAAIRYIEENGVLIEEDEFNKNFQTEYLVKALKDLYENISIEEIKAQNSQIKATQLKFDNGEEIFVYEYGSETQKNIALLEWRKANLKEGSSINLYSKGKIFVTYDEGERDIVTRLKEVMN